MSPARASLIWGLVAVAIAVPLTLALSSPLLEWRGPVYIVAGFAGVVAMAILLIQPLLASGLLPGLPPLRGRRVHRLVGGLLVLTLVVHVGGLWLTSPPDVIDALLFRSPTPFAVWGVIAMWAVIATAVLALFRRAWRISPARWRLIHGALAIVIIAGSVAHALLIEGTMEAISKWLLCALVILAGLRALSGMRPRRRRR